MRWIDEVKQELNLDNRQTAYTAVRAVLHSLRDRLTVHEATDLAAQLPLVLIGTYYEGWNPSNKPVKIRTSEKFLDMVNQNLGRRDDLNPLRITKAVFKVLKRHVTQGEIEDVISDLPKDIAALWE